MNNWKIWLQGLAAASIGGAATSATQMIASTGTVTGRQLGMSAGVGAIVTALAYLVKSPLAVTPPAPQDPPKS